MSTVDLHPMSKLRVSTPEESGFWPCPGHQSDCWRAAVREFEFEFRLLRGIDDLTVVEELQQRVFGVSERDLMAATMLIGVEETGGDVIGVFDLKTVEPQLVGFVTSIGGFVNGEPRLCSDMMAVDPAYRHFGLGFAAKRLQAALAIERGFTSVTWTVDPLRAANARLNFAKLGAFSDRYERNRYGNSYGAGLYGGMPTDRLHIVWPVTSARVQRVLIGESLPSLVGADMEVPIPADIDHLLESDHGSALEWRQSVRDALEQYLAEGYVVAGFRSEGSVLLLTRNRDSLVAGASLDR
ncbi:MAG: hypothetical protein IT335_15420 [Thermomicrobiales bacterium]|nr:hypothetical protein [Thermomicrobiales bacterium]